MDQKAVSDIRKLEEQLATARKNAHDGFLAAANESLEQLRGIGFEYELVEKNRKPKMGRPRKEKANGVALVQRQA